jgi:lysophospholipase L1-like esterase
MPSVTRVPTALSLSVLLLGACSDPSSTVSAVAASINAAGGCAPTPTAAAPSACLQRDSQLVVLGDSYLNWLTHDFPNDLTRALGHSYRFYAEPGASMASGGIATPVPEQLARAIADDADMIAGVMTGGGNDILLSDTLLYPGSDECKERPDSPTLQVCRDVVAAALDAARDLMHTAVSAGVQDVVYIYYPRIPGSLLGIFATSPNEILDYASPLARQVCEQAEADTQGALRCHFLDLQPIFEGHPEWFADDGIHENAQGSAVIAREVAALFEAHCIAQPAAKGCCAP